MKKSKRVILFGIDGAGTFFEQADTPNIDRIFKDGAYSGHTLTEVPSISAQCWGSMLHGVECGRHRLTNHIAGEKPYPTDSPYPSVFRVIHETMPDAKMASFSDWGSINKGIIEDGIGVYKYEAKDCDLVEPAIQYIRENDFTMLFFQFDSVDHAGHEYGYGTPQHLEAITRNDEYIGRIVEAVREREWMEDTLIMVEADHGGIGRGHGGAADAERYVSFFATGGNVRHTRLSDMYVRDTAPIILYALGIRQPESWTGRVPGGLFPECMENLPRPKGDVLPEMVEDSASVEEKGEFCHTFADLEPAVYLSFEEGAALPAGLQAHGKLYRMDGVAGMGMRFEDGYLTIPCPPLQENFSLMCWIKADEMNGQDQRILVAAGSSCRGQDDRKGVSLQLSAQYVRFCYKKMSPAIFPLIDMVHPAEVSGRWLHVVMALDRENGMFGISINFEPMSLWKIPEDFAFPEGVLYIGQDELEDREQQLTGVMDDFCICRKAIDDSDLRRLKTYYGL